ncbi:HAD hydrolase-like protein [Candidatus Dojkabacteria bacterium]|nr:HAD hydrolase-like protein [Candidatus Dojkabacteria bacterium]
MKFKAVLFDYFNVVTFSQCLFTTLREEYPDALSYIEKTIWGKNAEPKLLKRWMRNELTSKELNKRFADETGISSEVLQESYEKSATLHEYDDRVLKLARDLRNQGVLTAMVTDNVDTFTTITAPAHDLEKYFGVLVNSADHGVLKHDGGLYDIAMEKVGHEDYSTALMIDDTKKNIESFQSRGGIGYLYDKDFDKFLKWFNDNK